MKSSHRNFYVFILVMIFICYGSYPALAQTDTTFSDTEFLDTDWSAVKIIDTSVGQPASYSAYQVATDGNPGAYRHVTHEWCGDGNGSKGLTVGHLHNSAWYDPGALGPITNIDVSLDGIFTPLVNPNAVSCGPLVFQDGHYYKVQGTITAQSWTTVTFETLTDVDFVDLNGDPDSHPDFSGDGAPLQFGFFTANGTGGSDCPLTNSGYDNWQVTVAYPSSPVKTTSWGGIKALFQD
jgi:hypothetical protein